MHDTLMRDESDYSTFFVIVYLEFNKFLCSYAIILLYSYKAWIDRYLGLFAAATKALEQLLLLHNQWIGK